MKKIIKIMCISLVLLFFSTAVMAQDKSADTMGVYVGILGGYVMPTNINTTFTLPDGTTLFQESNFTTKSGYLYGAKVGWLTPFTKRILAVELEYNHSQSNFDTAKDLLGPVVVDLDGKFQMDMLMLNLLARYPNGIFHPYIGVGGGYANVKIDDITAYISGSPTFTFGGGSKGVFAYQVLAGFDVDVTKNIIVGVGYKYIETQKFSFDSLYVGAVPINAEMSYNSHNLTLSVSYLF